MKESNIGNWGSTPAGQQLEELLALVEEEIPADLGRAKDGEFAIRGWRSAGG